MSLDRIEPTTLLPDQVADRLRQAIVQGALQPGDRLREAEIAEQLGVSTIPVREAFRQLEMEGLVESQPRRGRFVRALTEQDLVDLFRARAALEIVAYEMIHQAGGMTAESLGFLRKNLLQEKAAIAAEDLVRAAELDVQFHDRIYHETSSELLLEMWQLLRARLHVFFCWRWQHGTAHGAMNATVDHGRILKALEGNDLDALRRLAEEIGSRVGERARQSLLEIHAESSRDQS